MTTEHDRALEAIKDPTAAALWARYHGSSEHVRALAAERLEALVVYRVSRANGLSKMQAIASTEHAMRKLGHRSFSGQSLGRWLHTVRGVPRADWLAALLPAYRGRTAWAEIPADAWHAFLADYRGEGNGNAAACYRRLAAQAGDRGWRLPAGRTFERRLRLENL